jgi:hypothetical protein
MVVVRAQRHAIADTALIHRVKPQHVASVVEQLVPVRVGDAGTDSVVGLRSMGPDGDTGRAERVANWMARSTGPQKFAAIVGGLFVIGLVIRLIAAVL